LNSLVYLSPVPWASFAQRPHRFVEWFQSVRGGRVLWLDPYPTRLPRLEDLRRLVGRAPAERPQDIPAWMEVRQVGAVPIEPLPGGTMLNALLWNEAVAEVSRFAARGGCELVIGKPSRFALEVLERVGFSRCTYDAMDDFPAFYGGLSRRALARVESRITARVDAVQASSTRLGLKFAGGRARVSLVRNACAPDTLPGVDTLQAQREPDVVGYLGTVASWFDWEMLASLARANPDQRFRVIGPLLSAPAADLPPNVELRPPCDHAAAMREMARFAVGLIPFKRNELTASVDPVKYYEYRATGIQVVSTDFGEMSEHAKRDPGVSLVAPAADLRLTIRTALARRDSPAAIHAFRASNSWASRFSLPGEPAAQAARQA
jgi:hypothetical protein